MFNVESVSFGYASSGEFFQRGVKLVGGQGREASLGDITLQVRVSVLDSSLWFTAQALQQSSQKKEFSMSRPFNTQKGYAGPVKEWCEFCRMLRLTYFAFEVKMLAYLNYVVTNIAERRQIIDRVKGRNSSFNVI
ncbi:hypothetical protein MIR68_007812 [Amoeboaphelidium protococcarum]|nr:hypothetical protein MIR68_007812 [Amoeboaphelidium protococcarum]KAI3645358.1 hypothetical protein MP228_008286 [Amoeboaphelidium protococcarum]